MFRQTLTKDSKTKRFDDLIQSFVNNIMGSENYMHDDIVNIYYNEDRRVSISTIIKTVVCLYIYIFRVTLSVISMGENSCPPYCRYRFKYLRK